MHNLYSYGRDISCTNTSLITNPEPYILLYGSQLIQVASCRSFDKQSLGRYSATLMLTSSFRLTNALHVIYNPSSSPPDHISNLELLSGTRLLILFVVCYIFDVITVKTSKKRIVEYLSIEKR
jgi:hypothetical protein